MTILYGFSDSVYSWIARLALAEKGVAFEWVEINPFEDDIDPAYLRLNPFRRVPAFVDGDFAIYETGAITRYIDDNFAGPLLQPAAPKERARLNQILSVIDSYAYWPLVRQVFSHGFYHSLDGETPDSDILRSGFETTPKVLGALEALAAPGPYLVGNAFSLADIHLLPIIAYFRCVPRAVVLMEEYPQLSVWWERLSQRETVLATRPSFVAI